MPKAVTATAGVNIALVKYWGKANADENLPAVGSISFTLNTLRTETTVSYHDSNQDYFVLNHESQDDQRVVRILDEVRQRTGISKRFKVNSLNHVPTASGLASSASGAAALVGAAWYLCTGSKDFEPALDIIRKGSGSAPRSLLGGLVELDKESGGVRQLSSPKRWPLSMVVVQLALGPKTVSSRQGMARTRDTSPYYQAWVTHHPEDLTTARDAIERMDLESLGQVMEHSTMKMHACMLAANPPLIYWNQRTLEVVEAVLTLRKEGVGAWYTMDAGPHVKILCYPEDAQKVHDRILTRCKTAQATIDTMGSGLEVRA